MKRKVLFIAAIIVAIIASVGTSAQTSSEITILNAVVSEINTNCKNISQQTGGVITKGDSYRSGRDIVINFYIGDKSFNIGELDAQTKDMLKDTLSDSFMQGILEDGDGEVGIAVFKSIGSKFHFNIHDAYDHVLSRTVDFKNL